MLFLFPSSETLGATLSIIAPFKAFVCEVILSFILMLVIINISNGAKEIGGIVLLKAAFADPISGASMNPARSLSPAVISGYLQHLWLYLLAPVEGCIISVASWKLVKEE